MTIQSGPDLPSRSTTNNTARARDEEGGRSAVVVRPTVLGFELLDHVTDRGVVKVGALERVADNVLDLVGAEGDDVLLEVVDVHIRGELRLGDRWVRSGDHLRPCTDVHFVDGLDHIL